MSLQIWMPLDGNLNNQGLLNISPTYSGTPTYTAGKIGQCLTSPFQLDFNNSAITFYSFSVAFWVKCKTGFSGDWKRIVALLTNNPSDSSTSQEWLRWEQASGSSYYRTLSSHNNAGYPIETGSTIYSTTSNTWLHIAYTYDSTTGKVIDYLNGVKLSERTGKIGGRINGRILLAQAYEGWLNDFRLYNHCLSPKEVKEISKGLVLHYPLNHVDGLVGGRNLARNTSSSYSSGYSSFSGVQNTCPGLATVYLPKELLKVGDKVTCSLDYKWENIVAASDRTAAFWPQGSGNVTAWNAGAFNGPGSTTFSGSGTKHFSWTFTLSQAHLCNDYWSVNIRHDYVQSGTVSWKNFKVGLGDKETAWTPAPEDHGESVYTIYDTSGYRHNGTVAGTINKNICSGSSESVVSVTTPTTASTVWGSGFAVPGSSSNCVVPYGSEYRVSVEVCSPVAARIQIDTNNYSATSGVSSWSGNDNDLTSARTTMSFNLSANTWTKLSWGSKNAHASNTSKASIYVNDSVGLIPQSSAVTWKYRRLKVELGNQVTPWTAYNASVTAPLSWTTDTPIGQGATNFVGNVAIAAGTTTKITDAITLSAWMYSSDWTTGVIRPISCTEGGGWNIENNGSNVGFALYKSGIGYQGAYTPRSGLTAGWHLLTGTYDGHQAKFYVDGVLKASGTNTDATTAIGYHASNGVFIGAEAGSNTTTPADYTKDGPICDVRIYSTALSASDIKELYETRFSIADNGTVFCGEIVEDGNTVKLGKNGIVKGNEFGSGLPRRNLLNGFAGAALSQTSTSSSQTYALDISFLNQHAGEPYTLSFKYTANNWTGSRFGIEPDLYNGSHHYNGLWVRTSANGTGSVSVTYTLPSNVTSNTQNQIYIQGTTSGTVTIYDFKMELGDSATSYCPAPVDCLSKTSIYKDISGVTLNVAGSGVGTPIRETNGFYYTRSDSSSGGVYTYGATFTAGKVYTVSVYVKTDSGTANFVYDNLAERHTIIRYGDTTITPKWKRLWCIFVASTGTATCFYVNGNASCTVHFKDIKIEEGSIATPWEPSSSELITTSKAYNNALLSREIIEL